MAEIVMTSGFVFNGYIHQVCDDGGIASGDDLGVALIKNEYNNQIHPIAQKTYDNIAQFIKEGATTVIEGVGVERVSSQATSSYFVKITAPENSPSTSPNNVFPIPNASGTGSLVIYTNPNSSDPADKVLVCWFGLSEEVTASTFDLSFDDGVILKYSPAQTYLYDIVTSAGDGKARVDETDAYPGFLYNKIMPGEGIVIDTSARGDEKFLKIGTSGCALWEYASNALRPKDNTKHLEIYTDGNVIVPSIGSTYALTIHSEAGTSGNGLALDVYGSQDIHNGKENNIALYVKNTNTNAQVAYLVQQNTSNSAPAFQVDNRGTFNTVRLHSYNSSNEAPVFHIESSGTGAAINVVGNGPALSATVSTTSAAATLKNEGAGRCLDIVKTGSGGGGPAVTISNSSPGSGCIDIQQTSSNTSTTLSIRKGEGLGIDVLTSGTAPSIYAHNPHGIGIEAGTSSSYPAIAGVNDGSGPALLVQGGLQIDRGTTEPTGKFEGMPFYNTTDKKYRYYDGTEWKDIGGSLPITAMGDLVVGDENGNAIRLPIGTSGQTLMVNSSGMIEYCDILTRNNVTSGNTIGTYTTSATSYNFLDIRGSYGYNSGSQEYIKNSGVRLSLNQNLFTVNTDGLDLGAPYRVDNMGCAIRSRRANSYGTRYHAILLGDVGYNQTSSYSTIGRALGIRVVYGGGNDNISIGSYGNTNHATSAFTAGYDISQYSSDAAKVTVMFPTTPVSTPEWDGGEYNSAKSYFTVGKWQTAGDGVVTICSSATNKYGDTTKKHDTVALRVRSGWSIFNDQIFCSSTTYVRGTLYPRKVIVGRTWPLSSTQYSDGGIVYGYGETSARDELTSYGKDPGRQYYTTDDNRVNVYNNTTSAWDKIAYLSDVGGGTNWYCGSFTSANRPANPTEGQYGYDTTIDCIIYYIGSEWKNAAGAVV